MKPMLVIGIVTIGLCLACKRDSDTPMSNENASREARDSARSTPLPPNEPSNLTPASGMRGPPNPSTNGTNIAQAKPSLNSGTTIPLAYDAPKASARFKPAKGYEVEGLAQLAETADGVHLTVTLDELPPGPKTVVLFEGTNCDDLNRSIGERSSVPTMSANPGEQTEPGQLAALDAGKDGKAKLDVVIANTNLKVQREQSLMGKALVVYGNKSAAAAQKAHPLACAPIATE